MFTTHWNKIGVDVKINFKDYLLNYLANKAGTLSLEILKAIIQCLLIIIKLAWLDDPAFQKIILDLQAFSQLSYNHRMIAFITYDSLIKEMDYYNKNRSLGQNRRVSMHFKDAALGEILLYSLKSLSPILNQALIISNEQQPALELLLQCLRVISDCFLFDFAIRFDETAEGTICNQMPSAWAPIIGNDSLLNPVFDVIFKLKSELHQILVTLIQSNRHLR